MFFPIFVTKKKGAQSLEASVLLRLRVRRAQRPLLPRLFFRKSGARFNVDKTKWFNHEYLLKKSKEEVGEEYLQWLETEKGIKADKDYVVKVTGLVKDRVNFVKELWDQSFFFFEAPTTYDEVTVKKRWKENSPELMRMAKELINGIDDFSAENIEKAEPSSAARMRWS